MEKVTKEELLKLNKKDLLGKIIVFPTDTVYGVGCLYLDSVGREKIYEMKKRDHNKNLPILLSKIEDAKKLAYIDEAHIKYTKHWPGALTLIFKANDKDYIHDTIALRMPNSSIALDILNHFGPMEVTSVNISGEKELSSVKEIEDEFKEYIDYLVIDDAIFSKVSSTVLSLVNEPIVLRQGEIVIK